ncbi:hypothetical protein L6164_011354 [Bauhinia variegata]|uniref:Uncharacterized protein n=1 Tax=Bauhinia variegata TaxID=167791 RepID=A0ACB9P5V6_BAUVA|nr:hypothetical protein L6164_011354 [Bauhinia variegata]
MSFLPAIPVVLISTRCHGASTVHAFQSRPAWNWGLHINENALALPSALDRIRSSTVVHGNGNANANGLPSWGLHPRTKLPVKSLVRFQSLLKDCAKIFKTPTFISKHLQHS